MLRKVKAVFFSIEFVGSILVVIVLMLAFKRHIHSIRRRWARVQRFFGAYGLKVEGHLQEQTQMIIMNHQSILDIVVMEESSHKNLCWVAKKEIGDIPIIGAILRIPKMIPLQRGSARAVVEMLGAAKERLKEGRVIAIFPEGTRGDGKHIARFKSGAKIMAQKLNLKVQPVLLVGTNVMDSKRFSFGRGDVKIIYLPPVDTSKEDWLENTRAMMQERLNIELKS